MIGTASGSWAKCVQWAAWYLIHHSTITVVPNLSSAELANEAEIVYMDV
jgi:hypothetical protein